MLASVTPLLITYNEEDNITRTLAGLAWAQRIVVVDSGSDDRTLAILAVNPRVQVFQRRFDSFAQQCNFGLSLISTPWCLSLDADHVVTSRFVREMADKVTSAPAEVSAILTPFRYCVYGRPLRASLLPPRLNLVRPDGGSYRDDGHAHRFIPTGRILAMRAPLLHDDRKPLSRWLANQQRYLEQEADKLLHTPHDQLSFSDRLRKRHVIAPTAVFLLCLLRHGLLLDGWRGWFYAFQRLYAEILLSLILWETRQARLLESREPGPASPV